MIFELLLLDFDLDVGSIWIYFLNFLMQQNTNFSNLGLRTIFRKVSKCKSRYFLCQDYFIPWTSVKSTLYNKNFACKLQGNVNCKTTYNMWEKQLIIYIKDFLETRQQLIKKKLITI